MDLQAIPRKKCAHPCKRLSYSLPFQEGILHKLKTVTGFTKGKFKKKNQESMSY